MDVRMYNDQIKFRSTPPVCKQCGGPIIGKRTDAKFCTIACKQRYYRQRRRVTSPICNAR